MGHSPWMLRALELAERGRGFVEPNPLVGAVLVKEGNIVGEGWHERFGSAHAEVNALRQAGAAARGAELYVTLEPCCHHGKTPPCTDAIMSAGVARVFAALADPFPQVAGQGATILNAAGIPTIFGLNAAQSRRQNVPYFTLQSKGRPHVHGKWAMSLDGKIATHTGESKWISGEESRRLVHEIRGRMDGIVVGIGTALADFPLLTARPPGPRIATRVVLDSRARLPLDSPLVQSARNTPTLIAVAETADEKLIVKLRQHGCEVLPFGPGKFGALDLDGLLAEFGRRRWTNLLVEGGSAVLGSFAEADLLDELHVFIAPKILGGATAPGPVGGQGIASIANVTNWPTVEIEVVGADAYIHACKEFS